MTENDKKLIEKAKDLCCSEWDSINSLIDRADSDSTKRELEEIMVEKFHREEYLNGSL